MTTRKVTKKRSMPREKPPTRKSYRRFEPKFGATQEERQAVEEE